MAYRRSVLKWAGSKYLVLKHLIPHLPKGQRLIEPFMGGGSVFLNTNYDGYILGEKNPDLYHFFVTLKNEGPSFIDACETYFDQKYNQKLAYYELRDNFNAETCLKKRASLFLYLNRHGYNGLCRFNQNQRFNVPFGRNDKPYFPRKEMQYFFEKSTDATFYLADFKETFKKAKPGDVIYCDPPYIALSPTASFKNYTADGFDDKTQVELANLARKAANKNISVIISNHDTPFAREIYKGARFESFEVRRMISVNGNARQMVKELVAIF